MAIKYMIVMGKTAYGLEAEVNKYVAKGYQPVGGICSDEENLMQAMVIPEPISKDQWQDYLAKIGFDPQPKNEDRIKDAVRNWWPDWEW